MKCGDCPPSSREVAVSLAVRGTPVCEVVRFTQTTVTQTWGNQGKIARTGTVRSVALKQTHKIRKHRRIEIEDQRLQSY
eukprot:3951177-Amphidinium_carterae.1